MDSSDSTSTARLLAPLDSRSPDHVQDRAHSSQTQVIERMEQEHLRRWSVITMLKLRMLYLYVLIGLNLFNYIDRFTVSGVMNHIKKEMNLSDQQEGLLQTAFIVSYMLLAPIFGYLGDRMNRKMLIILGMAVWTSAVMVSSFLKTYYPFLAMRMLVGVGEAAYSTVAPAVIADLFTDAARTRAIVAFYIAIPVGSGLGYIIGSSVAAMTGHWSWGLRISPIAGAILIIVFALFFREPVRGAAEDANLESTSYLEDIVELCKIPTYVLLNIGCIAVYFVTGALSWWTPSVTKYAYQVIHESPDPRGSDYWFPVIVGLIMMFGGILGMPIGSFLARWWANGFTLGCLRAKPNPRSDPLYCGIALLVSVPPMWLSFYCMLNFSLIPTWICLFLVVLLLTSNFSITTDVTMYVTPPNRRSSANAFQILIAHLFGDAGSPYIVGIISDNFKHRFRVDRDNFYVNFFSLRDALLLTALMLPIGALFYLLAALTVEKDRENEKLVVSSSRGRKNEGGRQMVAAEGAEEPAAAEDAHNQTVVMPAAEGAHHNQTAVMPAAEGAQTRTAIANDG